MQGLLGFSKRVLFLNPVHFVGKCSGAVAHSPVDECLNGSNLSLPLISAAKHAATFSLDDVQNVFHCVFLLSLLFLVLACLTLPQFTFNIVLATSHAAVP